MERFSAYRDPGTGIHPFLPPTAPSPPSVLHSALIPLRAIAAALRVVLLVALAVVWGVLRLVSLLLLPVPPLYSIIARGFDAALAQSCFIVLGFLVSEEVVAVNRSRAKDLAHARWTPKRGDLIISNWVSWPEMIWFAAKYRATFVLPLAGSPPPPASTTSSSPISSTGRRTGTGSAAISLPPPVSNQPRSAILGFRRVGLFEMLGVVGKAPPFFESEVKGESIEEIRKTASGPVVVFPECTTSNGRALMRFSDVFGQTSVPVKGYNVWLACVKYEPPSNTQPTLACSTPSSLFSHILLVSSALAFQSVSLRLLNSGESPSSAAFLASQYVSPGTKDQLSECAGALIAQMGRLRRTQLGWEDKVGFLEFYEGKRRNVVSERKKQ